MSDEPPTSEPELAVQEIPEEAVTLPVASTPSSGQTAPLVIGTVVPEVPGGLAADLDGVPGGGFTTRWAKSVYIAMIRQGERELNRSHRRADALEDRQRDLVDRIGDERVQIAELRAELRALKVKARTRDLLNGAGGTFFGTGIGTIGTWPVFVSIAVAVAGAVMLVIAWQSSPGDTNR
jgi:hypothetical protein